MNEVFLLGKVEETYKFKFVYGKNLVHKSVIRLKVRMIDGELIDCKGYDDIADEILRNEFKFVCIYGRIRTEGIVEIKRIYQI